MFSRLFSCVASRHPLLAAAQVAYLLYLVVKDDD